MDITGANCVKAVDGPHERKTESLTVVPAIKPTFAIITPLPVEWRAICLKLRDQSIPSDQTLPTKLGYIGNHPVVCVRFGKGEGDAAAALQYVSGQWSPRWIILMGIAAGFPDQVGRAPGRGPKLGDVLIANFIYHLDYGKLADGKYQRRPEKDFSPDHSLLLHAETLADEDTSWAERITLPRPDRRRHTATNVKIGYVASGNKVIDDPSHDFFQEVLTTIPELDGVEMEACGAGAALRLEQSHRLVGFLMVRGISDQPPGGSKQRAAWRRYAAAAAAAFVEAFLTVFSATTPPKVERLSLQTLDIALDTVFRERPRIQRPLVQRLRSVVMDQQALLVEGPKGSGKSAVAILVLMNIQDVNHGGSPIYYLNGEELRTPGKYEQVMNVLVELPPESVFFFDDLHREPRQATRLALEALTRCRAKLLLVSREVANDDYQGLRGKFEPLPEARRAIFDMSQVTDAEELRAFIRAALEAYGKDASDEVVKSFLDHYPVDLTALFDAIEEWRTGEIITDKLADQRIRARLEADLDFELPDIPREEALACFLAVAHFWQFEIATSLDFLATALGLNERIPRLLAEHRVIRQWGQPGQADLCLRS
jgi:nucleoside phosphorylase